MCLDGRKIKGHKEVSPNGSGEITHLQPPVGIISTEGIKIEETNREREKQWVQRPLQLTTHRR